MQLNQSLPKANNNQLGTWPTTLALFVFCIAATIAAPAQTFTTLANLGTNGTGLTPTGNLVQGFDGNFYGTTDDGPGLEGSNPNCPSDFAGCGTIFKVTPQGVLTNVYSFCAQPNCTDGAGPYFSPLIQVVDGSFYGATIVGGVTCSGDTRGCGTIFKITPDGTLTTLHRFSGAPSDGARPEGALVEGTDGNFYGTTGTGGAHDRGTVFRMTPAGNVTVLFSFGTGPHGNTPIGLIQGIDWQFYGANLAGGSASGPCAKFGCGTIYRITRGGGLTTLFAFDGTDGNSPALSVQATDGDFYGNTFIGGTNNSNGTIFKITSTGELTTLYDFCASLSGKDCLDGSGPYGPIQASDGKFYGTTTRGGIFTGGTSSFCYPQGCGTIFQITPGGTLTTLYAFDGTGGESPFSGVIQGTDGKFYGTTTTSNTTGNGIVYSLDVGLAPFIQAQPARGNFGAPIVILGNNLTGTTAVTFNGTPATFTVVSDTEITTSVPVGARNGPIEVTRPSGNLFSNFPFRVTTPRIFGFSPSSGAVGTSVVITGESFTGASAVSFNGTLATSFTVDSDTQITATVPAGATTGWIAVRTPGGRVQSTGTFTVTP